MSWRRPSSRFRRVGPERSCRWSARLLWRCRNGVRCPIYRQDDGECRAFAFLTFQPDPTVVLIDDAFDDRQTQASPFKFADVTSGAIELIENVGLIFLRDANAVIAH